jgi:hypothetical protein
MLIGAGRLELLPLVRHGACLLYDPSCVHQPGDVQRIARLLISNRRLCRILIACLVLPLVSLERGRSTQISPANTNRYLLVPSKRPLLAYGNLALALQRLLESVCRPLAAVEVGWPHI